MVNDALKKYKDEDRNTIDHPKSDLNPRFGWKDNCEGVEFSGPSFLSDDSYSTDARYVLADHLKARQKQGFVVVHRKISGVIQTYCLCRHKGNSNNINNEGLKKEKGNGKRRQTTNRTGIQSQPARYQI